MMEIARIVTVDTTNAIAWRALGDGIANWVKFQEHNVLVQCLLMIQSIIHQTVETLVIWDAIAPIMTPL